MLDITDDGRTLKAAFPDGRTFELPAEMLRVMSPSAEVQGHSPDQRVTVARKKNVRISDLKGVGNYATRITFDDGHNTGPVHVGLSASAGQGKGPALAGYLDELAAKGLSRE